MGPDDRETLTIEPLPPGGKVERFRVSVLDGPVAGTVYDAAAGECQVGSHARNSLVLDDSTVSRFHCELSVTSRGVRLRDLGSRNGTILDGVIVNDAFARPGSIINVGRITLRFDLSGQTVQQPISDRAAFGSLVGQSSVARMCFALLERAAKAEATVLLEGETGTGKSRAAQGIHELSSRRSGPFVVVDCGALPANLLESELFGHEKGAFTGASSTRIGAFEEAHGGTLFLDEIGELPADLQPKLLRAIEHREIRRVGSNQHRPIDLRIIAATNRDLRRDVNVGRFRSDLYFRLAVLRITLPSLRQRCDDIPMIAKKLLASLGGATSVAGDSIYDDAFFQQLKHAAWPGNVRELRNHLERCLALGEASAPWAAATDSEQDWLALPYPRARRAALDDFERRYVQALLGRHGGKVAEAAQAADIDRVYLYRLIKRHGLHCDGRDNH